MTNPSSLQRLHRALDDFREEHGSDPDRIVIDPDLGRGFVVVESFRAELWELRLSPTFVASLLQ